VLAARRADRLHGVAESLRKDGVEVLEVVADVAVPRTAGASWRRPWPLRRGGRAGEQRRHRPGGAASRDTVADFRAVIDVNLNGAFWMAQAAGAVMQPGSAIVNVASVLGLVSGQYPQASYAASKAG